MSEVNEEGVEIGRVYSTPTKDKPQRRYYLSIGTHKLVSAYNGHVRTVKPDKRMLLVQSISVQDLCDIWEVDMDFLDQISNRYLYCNVKKDPTHINKRGREKTVYTPLIHRIAQD